MINLFCALPCEAKPLTRCYQLTRHPDAQLFRTFVDQNHTISLTIMGTGKASAAAAVLHAYMLLSASKYDGWINFGIAGHSNLSPGTSILANKIIERASGRSWYPQILFNTGMASETVITLDKPSAEYPDQGVIDMEASAFYETASRIGLAELTHSLKFISDNRQCHYTRLSSKSVSVLVENNLDNINNLVVEISALSEILNKPDQMQTTYDEIITHWHFTHTQRIQLKKILNRWNTLLPDMQLDPDLNLKHSSGKQLLSHLSTKLDNLATHYE